jgi:hypothetical protein
VPERALLALRARRKLDEDDVTLIAAAVDGLTAVPGDCGDEYRKPPFLTGADTPFPSSFSYAA